MPIVIPHGLKGLDGLNSLKPEEQNAFISTISDQLGHSGNFRQREQRANIIYMNQRFIDTFGRDAFDKMNDGSEESFKLRNNYLKEQTIKMVPGITIKDLVQIGKDSKSYLQMLS